MNCKNCNTVLNDTMKYCEQCGTLVKSEKKNLYIKRMSLILSFCIIIIMLTIYLNQIVSADPNSKVQETKSKTFLTPKQAIEYFVDALRKGDLQKMDEASGIDLVSKKFDFPTYSFNMKSVKATSELLPTKYSQFISINKVIIENNCVHLYIEILKDLQKKDSGSGYPCNTTKDASDFEDNIINPENLKNLKIKNLSDVTNPNTVDNNITAHGYGADELKLFNLDLTCNESKISITELMVLRYGKSWYLWQGFNIE